MNIAFIGTGVMGISMARNLIKNGHSLRCTTRTMAKAQPLLQDGASLFPDITSCIQDCQAIITMVGYPRDVEQVYLGAGGILETARQGTLVIDMTTTSPSLWQDIASKARAAGLLPLDAPVSGGDSGARDATLAIMVGGNPADFEAALPLFSAMGRSIRHLGGDGAGQHCKMANQIAIAGAVSGVAEALNYAQQAGLDPGEVIKAIQGGAAASWQLSNNGPKMLSGDSAPGFYIKHFVKDLSIAREEGQKRSLDLPILQGTLSHYQQMEEIGQGDLGTQAIFEFYADPGRYNTK